MSNWKDGIHFTSLSLTSISMQINGVLFTVSIFTAEWQSLAKLPRLLLQPLILNG